MEVARRWVREGSVWRVQPTAAVSVVVRGAEAVREVQEGSVAVVVRAEREGTGGRGTVAGVKGAVREGRARAVRVGTAVWAVAVVLGWVVMATVLAWVAVAPCMEEDLYRAEVDLEGALYRAQVEKAGASGAEVARVDLGGGAL